MAFYFYLISYPLGEFYDLLSYLCYLQIFFLVLYILLMSHPDHVRSHQGRIYPRPVSVIWQTLPRIHISPPRSGVY